MDHYSAHLFPKRSTSGVQKYKDKFMSLPIEEKLIAAGLFITMIGCFLPWANFPGVDNVRAISYNGFQGVTYFIGYAMMALAGIGFLGLTAKFLEIKKMEQLSSKLLPYYTIASAQVVFLSIITYTIYSSFYKIKYSGSYIEFGITVCLIGGLVTLVGSYFAYTEARRAVQRKKSLHHLHDIDDEASRILDQYAEDREFQSFDIQDPNQTTLIEEPTYDRDRRYTHH